MSYFPHLIVDLIKENASGDHSTSGKDKWKTALEEKEINGVCIH
jgi:hypothetical protein